MSTRYILALDTAIRGAAFGLFQQEEDSCGELHLLATAIHAEPLGASRFLSKGLAQVLELRQLCYQDLAGVVVGLGPGSFTGIKVGIAFCQGLARGSSVFVPMVGISGLAALGQCHGGGWILPATQAQGYGFFPAAGADEDPKRPQGLVVLRLDEEGLTVQAADSREQRRLHQLPPMTTLLHAWPRLTALPMAAGAFAPPENRYESVLASLVSLAKEPLKVAAAKGPDLEPALAPCYLRKASPEELLEKN